MYWLTSLLFYKTFLLFSLFTTFVLSCSPEINNEDVFSISRSDEPKNRFQLYYGGVKPTVAIYTVNGDDKPVSHEIFQLTQPASDSYDAGSENQRFSIVCDKCNSQTNSADWAPYHTSCSIKNKASNLCVKSVGNNNNLIQSDCGSAMKWDLIGRVSPTGSSQTPIKTDPNNVQISKGGLAATVLGSIIGTSLIALAAGYWFIKRKRIYP
ncbi:15293_t:CDS:2, partial [Rhizophagus irregularis]